MRSVAAAIVCEAIGGTTVLTRGEAFKSECDEVISGVVVEAGALSSEKNGWVSSRLGDGCGAVIGIRGDWLLGDRMGDGGG